MRKAQALRPPLEGAALGHAPHRPQTYAQQVGSPAAGSQAYLSGWRSLVPYWAGWISAISSLTSLLLYLFGRSFLAPGLHAIQFILDITNVPVGHSLFIAVASGLMSLLLFWRKRIGANLIIAFQTLIALAMILNFAAIPLDVEPYSRTFVAQTAWTALVAIAWIILFSIARPAFPGQVTRSKWMGALGVMLGGQFIVFGCGVIALRILRPAQDMGLNALWVFRRMIGREVIEVFVDTYSTWRYGPGWLSITIGLASGIVTLIAAIIFVSGAKQALRSASEDLQLRTLIATWDNDSLGYFATRANRSLAFAQNGQAAVSYAVSAGVAVAAGDPVGDPDAWDDAILRWLNRCYTNGWVPAVMSASARGARAYKRVGMTVRSMGDEAVIVTSRFNISAPAMRPLARTARKIKREGVVIEVSRLQQLSADELVELRRGANVFRNGDERGFSMALDRHLHRADPQTLIVTARGTEGQLLALLTFVPWGRKGISLDLMRRDNSSPNGIIEAMIVTLIDIAQNTGIEKISLNFAMFRKVFAEGDDVGAGVIQRIQNRIMSVASKYWQLETLYESNARYDPNWVPRYFCFITSPWIFQSFIAIGMLEGFIPTPPWYNTNRTLGFLDEDAHLHQIDTIIAALNEPSVEWKRSQQTNTRLAKAQRLRALGREPYPAGVEQGIDVSDVDTADINTITVHGRIRGRRDHGGVIFYDLCGRSGCLQLIAQRDLCADFGSLRLLDLGDAIAVTGRVGKSRTGTVSFIITEWQILAKSLHPFPARGEVLSGMTKVRNRTLDLATNTTALRLLQQRCDAVTAIRTELTGAGYTEVETPILQAVQGGANARPFTTHMNAYSTDVFLRIAPELYLKRLAVAGMGAIFEMGRSFRNEGADATHNPEFTSLEAYRAGADYGDMRRLTEAILRAGARAIHGRAVAWQPARPGDPIIATVDGQDMTEVDLSQPWPVIPVYQAVSAATGVDITPATTVTELTEILDRHGIDPGPNLEHGYLIGQLYDELVEANTWEPTFYTDFPVSTSPLTRKHRDDPRLAERWDLVAFGMEIGTAYTELTDPVDQRERFTAQSLAAAAGDPEAMSLDEDFLNSLELGLVPTGGLGLGVDRAVMMLTGVNIRATLAFPFVRPEGA